MQGYDVKLIRCIDNSSGRLQQTRSPRGTTIPYRSWFAMDGKMASVVTSAHETAWVI